MKVKKSTIPSGSLTENYLPADYSDVYACVTDTGKEIIPDDIMVNFWTDFPRWINALFKLRDFLAKLSPLQKVIFQKSLPNPIFGNTRQKNFSR